MTKEEERKIDKSKEGLAWLYRAGISIVNWALPIEFKASVLQILSFN